MSQTLPRSSRWRVGVILVGLAVSACGESATFAPQTNTDSAFSVAVGETDSSSDDAPEPLETVAPVPATESADSAFADPTPASAGPTPAPDDPTPASAGPTPAFAEPTPASDGPTPVFAGPTPVFVAPTQPPQAPQVVPVPRGESVADLVERVDDGVMFVEVRRCDGPATGTGFAVADNRVVTAAHVIDGASEIIIMVDDYRAEADIVGVDVELDLALLSVSKPLSGWHFTFADKVRIGDEALVMGYPAALDFTVTQGSVTAVDAKDPNLSAPVIRFDAAANPGNSGGPVVNRAGEVIGVVNGSRTDLDSVNYAIDAQATKRRVDSWSGSTPRRPDAKCTDSSPAPATGYVTVIASHPEASAVDAVFETYVGGINTGHPEHSWAMFTKSFQAALGTQADFAAGNETSFLYDYTVTSISNTASGLAVEANFVSTQQPSYGPNGWPCAQWKLTYSLVWDGSGYLIDGARHRQGSPASCDAP